MNNYENSIRYLMQGDQYNIPIEILTSNGIANLNTFEDIEVQIGPIRKTLGKKQITYDSENKVFLFPLRQEDSFRLKKKNVEVQVRVKLFTGDIIGTSLGYFNIEDALSRVKLWGF